MAAFISESCCVSQRPFISIVDSAFRLEEVEKVVSASGCDVVAATGIASIVQRQWVRRGQ
jgi:hypothetical protein